MLATSSALTRSSGVCTTSNGFRVAHVSAPRRLFRAPRQPVATEVSPGDVIRIVSQVATVAALGVSAWMLTRNEMQVEQDNFEQRSRGETCPTCEGSGYESCICTRWSDSDVGCNACSKTGYMKCRSCGGGGTAVPIFVPIRKVDPVRHG